MKYNFLLSMSVFMLSLFVVSETYSQAAGSNKLSKLHEEFDMTMRGAPGETGLMDIAERGATGVTGLAGMPEDSAGLSASEQANLQQLQPLMYKYIKLIQHADAQFAKAKASTNARMKESARKEGESALKQAEEILLIIEKVQPIAERQSFTGATGVTGYSGITGATGMDWYTGATGMAGYTEYIA